MLIAAYLVVTMPLVVLRWLVIVVVVYAAAVMFRASLLGRREGKSADGPVTAVL